MSERDVLTPGQVADYLQVNRETVYRYIRQGKLVASRLGRTYRAPKENIDLLLYATSGPVRSFSNADVEGFLRSDVLSPQQSDAADKLLSDTVHKAS